MELDPEKKLWCPLSWIGIFVGSFRWKVIKSIIENLLYKLFYAKKEIPNSKQQNARLQTGLNNFYNFFLAQILFFRSTCVTFMPTFYDRDITIETVRALSHIFESSKYWSKIIIGEACSCMEFELAEFWHLIGFQNDRPL